MLQGQSLMSVAFLRARTGHSPLDRSKTYDVHMVKEGEVSVRSIIEVNNNENAVLGSNQIMTYPFIDSLELSSVLQESSTLLMELISL